MGEGSKRGGRLIRIVLLLVGGLLAAEVGLRIYAGAKGVGHDDLRSLFGRESAAAGARDPELTRSGMVRPSSHEGVIYELEPDVRGTLGGRLVHTNERGMRGREIGLEKPAGTYRIAGLGDSHMFGTGVAQGQTYLDLLERRLNAAAPPGQRYETLNFATPGFNTAQEVALFEARALEFEPDLVIVHFINDDLGLPRYLGDPSNAPAGRPVSYLVALLASFGRSTDEEELAPPLLVRPSEAGEQLIAGLADRNYMSGQEGAKRALERLARLTAERGIPVVVMMLGEGGATRTVVREIAEGLGLQVLNVLPRFRERLMADGVELTRDEWKSAYFIRGDHPSELAHRVYAEALHEKVLELQAPPAGDS